MATIDVRDREQEDKPHRRRSVLVSPSYKFSPPGSRWGSFNFTWSQLRQLAKLSPTMQAIIALRQAQLASFIRAPRHKGDGGFEIVRADGKDLTDHDKKVIDYVFQFIMRTGAKKAWGRLSFLNLVKASVRDLMVIGSSAWELVYDEDGRLSEIWAIDAATIELQWAERYIPTTRYGRELHQPVRYVQVVDGQIETEYAEDELVYLRYSPLTDLENGGYPMGPTEAAADWIAAEILAMQYNSNYFDHGSVPPGILAIIGNVSEETLQELNVMWETDVKGVVGQHKPVALALEPSATGGSSIQWIPMKASNKDMEMGDFLDKLTTKIASIALCDPVEIGHRVAAVSGGISSSDNTKAKIDLSRDKGLLPLLDLFEQAINEHIMPKLAPGYVFRWTGITAEDEMEKVEYLNKQLQQGALTVREWRKAMGLDEVPPGTPEDAAWLDAPGNPQLIQVWMQERMMQQPQANEPEQTATITSDVSETTQQTRLRAIQGGAGRRARVDDDEVAKSWADY